GLERIAERREEELELCAECGKSRDRRVQVDREERRVPHVRRRYGTKERTRRAALELFVARREKNRRGRRQHERRVFQPGLHEKASSASRSIDQASSARTREAAARRGATAFPYRCASRSPSRAPEQ